MDDDLRKIFLASKEYTGLQLGIQKFYRTQDEEGEPVMNLEDYACKVCGNPPDEEGVIEHGRGCYVVSEDGGGFSYVELPADLYI